MFEGDSADMCAGNFPLMSIGGRAEGLACADRGVRTPIGVRVNLEYLCNQWIPFSNLKLKLRGPSQN